MNSGKKKKTETVCLQTLVSNFQAREIQYVIGTGSFHHHSLAVAVSFSEM